MTKKKTPISKTLIKKAEEKAVKVTKIEKPEEILTNKPFTFEGAEELEKFIPGSMAEVEKLVKKFQGRLGVKLKYIHKFRSFKLIRANQHVDWITLNDLTKRYDCRMAPVKMTSHPQRPFKADRVY